MYLGIDIGTSSVKAVLVDDSAAIVAQASDSLAVSRPQPGFSEADPDANVAADSAKNSRDDRNGKTKSHHLSIH